LADADPRLPHMLTIRIRGTVLVPLRQSLSPEGLVPLSAAPSHFDPRGLIDWAIRRAEGASTPSL